MESSRAVFLRNPNNRVGRAVAVVTSGLAALALTASGCGGSSAPKSSETSSQSSGRDAQPTLVFDDLGGGSSVIEVFPSPTSKRYNGTFYDGDTVQAICKVQGREVHSNPSVGELKRQSDEWVHIHGSPGEVQYATAVYADHPTQLLKQLPEC